MAGDTEPDPKAEDQPSKGSSLGDLAAAQAKVWTDATERIRQRTDITAKLAGSLATLGLGAITLSKFSDIFPLPSTPSRYQALAVLGVLAGLVAMAYAVGLLTKNLWKVSEPVFMSADLDTMKEELSDTDEYNRVAAIYDHTAKLNRADNLYGYALRGVMYGRIATQAIDEDARSAADGLATQITAEVIATEARAGTNVVRMRAARAVLGKTAVRSYMLFVAALIIFGVATDYLESERAGRIASAKSCADAVKAIRAGDPESVTPAAARLLPKLCGGKDAVPAPTASDAETAANADVVTAGAVKDLAVRYEACTTADPEGSKCSKIRGAMQALLPNPAGG